MMRVLGATLILVLLVTLAGCSLPGSAEEGLKYSGVTEITVHAGEFIPGTGIQFLGQGEQGARVKIDGQEVIRLLGDSLIWEGRISEGVDGKVNLRVLHISDDRLITSGLVTLIVHDPEPQRGKVDEKQPVRYTLPVAYKVPVGKTIPGTLLRYAGPQEGKGAHLEGLEGYPYRAIGDSILWEGKLRPNVDLILKLRVLFFNDSLLQVLGTATVLTDHP